jgi:glycosyltransferase involved in cell wall biosynthesis
MVFRTGFEQAMRRGADIIVNIDGDGQFNPADIRELIRPIIDDRADFVTCSRFADPALRPDMPVLKYLGNHAVTGIINWVCGGTCFTDVSCGFRAFNREAAYRLTLFGRYTYTQETFIDLFAKGLRIVEVPLKVRGVREHGKSRVARSVVKYAWNSLPIILRAMRDIQPLKFFGGIALFFGMLGLLGGGFVAGWYLYYHRTTPYQSLIIISGILVVLSFVLGVLALLADMLGRQRRITEELLYLTRKRSYQTPRLPRLMVAPLDSEAEPTGEVRERSATERKSASM